MVFSILDLLINYLIEHVDDGEPLTSSAPPRGSDDTAVTSGWVLVPLLARRLLGVEAKRKPLLGTRHVTRRPGVHGEVVEVVRDAGGGNRGGQRRRGAGSGPAARWLGGGEGDADEMLLGVVYFEGLPMLFG